MLIEFTGDRLTGRAAEELLDLIDRGIIRVYDVAVVGKDADGEVYAVDLAEEERERAGWVHRPAWTRSGLIARRGHARGGLGHGAGHPRGPHGLREHLGDPVRARLPASRAASVAGGRIPAQDVMDALAALDETDPCSPPLRNPPNP